MRPDFIENEHRLVELRAVKQDWGDNMEPGVEYPCWFARFMQGKWQLEQGAAKVHVTHAMSTYFDNAYPLRMWIADSPTAQMLELTWTHAGPSREGALRQQLRACARTELPTQALWELLGTLRL